MMKVLHKLGIGETLLRIVKAIYHKPAANIISRRGKAKIISSHLDKTSPISLVLLSEILENLVRAVQIGNIVRNSNLEKRKKGERKRISLCS